MGTRKPVNTGLDWLRLSLASFNGSGYADKTSPRHYVASYKAYKKWKKEKYALEMVEAFPEEAFEEAKKLVNARPAGHNPSERNKAKFRYFYNQERLEMWR